jgi:hypothetical protein
MIIECGSLAPGPLAPAALPVAPAAVVGHMWHLLTIAVSVGLRLRLQVGRFSAGRPGDAPLVIQPGRRARFEGVGGNF